MKQKKDVRLYNVIFPFWMLILFPAVWLIVLPGNFIIDSIVLIVSMFALKMESKKDFYKKHILKIFTFGMLADIVGSGVMLLMLVLEIGAYGDEPVLTLPGILVSAALIFVVNYFITFRKVERDIRLRMSLIFTIVTAPYTFLIPTSWMY